MGKINLPENVRQAFADAGRKGGKSGSKAGKKRGGKIGGKTRGEAMAKAAMKITIGGITKTVTEWAKQSGIKRGTIYWRWQNKFPATELLKPV